MNESDARKVDRICNNKRSFYTTRHASRAAAKIRNSDGPKMRWYKCHVCEKWHLTSQAELTK